MLHGASPDEALSARGTILNSLQSLLGFLQRSKNWSIVTSGSAKEVREEITTISSSHLPYVLIRRLFSARCMLKENPETY
jgi:hypothetical protein